VSEILRIADFGTQGLNSDLPACELPPGFITSGINFATVNGAIVNYGGYQQLLGPPFSAKFIYPVDADLDYLVFITADAVWTYNGSTFYNITGPAMADGGYAWTGTNVGRIAVFANEDNYPFVWQTGAPTDPVVDLVYDALAGTTWRSVNIRAKSIRSFGPFLIAMNINDQGLHYPDVVQWSHPADVGSIPDSWDYFRDDRLANRVNLGGNGGDIIDGGVLRDSFVIYRENGITLMSATQDEFVFSIRHISEIASAANVRCIAEVKGTHFVMTYDDIIAYDGNSLTSIIHQKIRKQFVSSLDTNNIEAAFAVKNELAKEILFCIPTGDIGNTLAYIFNWRDSSWSVRELPNIHHATFGPIVTSTRTWDTWKRPDSVPIDWDKSVGVWNQGKTSPFSKSLVGLQENNGTDYIVNMYLAEPDSPFTSRIERTDIPLGGHDVVTAIQRIYPHIEGAGSVNISMGSQDYANGPVRWKGPVKFNIGVDRKLDIRTSGELHAFKIESIGTEPWRLSGMDVEYVIAGKR
jgi:hypothetical protein